ncbi:MAG: DnaD domain protein [Anaerovoracaceae bacterium]
MNYIKGKIKDFYLLTSEIENIFLNEYMPGAPGDHVKVYLFGYMYAQQGEEMSHETLARQLRLSLDQVNQAWTYWADMGVVKKHPRKDADSGSSQLNYDVEFLHLREQMYRSPLTAKQEETESFGEEPEGLLQNENVKTLLGDIQRITGRTLSTGEVQEIHSWLTDLGANPEVIEQAYSYCVNRGKSNVKYISRVVMQWTEQGFQTKEEVQKYLDELDQRFGMQKRILQSLGMNRSATEAEKELINRWFDEMHFSLERILEACGRTVSISNPNLRYVNKILENWYQEAKKEGRDVNKKVTVTQTVLNRYYEFLRKKEEKEAQERKEQIYEKLPRIEQIDRMLSELGSNISRSLLSGGKRSDIEEIRCQMKELESERAVLLTENNFPIDYTDLKYSCEICRDTGMTEDGRRCTCTGKRTEEAELWQKSN